MGEQNPYPALPPLWMLWDGAPTGQPLPILLQGDGGTVWHGSVLQELGKTSVGSASTLISEVRSLAAGSVLRWRFLEWRG